jgi:hypothetical protein
MHQVILPLEKEFFKAADLKKGLSALLLYNFDYRTQLLLLKIFFDIYPTLTPAHMSN